MEDVNNLNNLAKISLTLYKSKTMSTAELRKVLHKYIDYADETFLKMVHSMSKEYENPDIAGYNVDGTPITAEELKERAKAASSRVKAGEYFTQEEVEKDIENW
ncbi:hypothetical protein LCGC14_2726890 [marine sediment metagenome]|uniref:Uncharacterized protein n=1 Tax=marine sediment metagenome TaxID=412755 RepID=A0A0F9BHF8_9ZZZZ